MDAEKERDRLVYFAKLAEQAERYDEVVDAMKSVAKMDVELTVEERTLLSVGYKNVIGSRRASWRILSTIEHKETVEGHEQNVKTIKDYMKRVEDELTTICNDVLSIANHHLFPPSKSEESYVFYHKMKGDYFRYLAEYKSGEDRNNATYQSRQEYETATTIAALHMPPTHPIRLGVALNFSVFYYEIIACPERACFIAKQALDDVVTTLESLGEELCRDSSLIVQLIKDNLTLWTKDIEEEGGEQPKAGEPQGK